MPAFTKSIGTTGQWLVLALSLTALVYFPGLKGPLVFDDYHNIAHNKALAEAARDPSALWQALVAGSAGPLKRPLSTLSFAANLATTGQNVWWFKATNVAIHLLNGVLVFLLFRTALCLRNRLFAAELRAPHIAAAAAALWLVHPAQLTSVLYVVQRMTSLSATFLLVGLALYCWARTRALASRPSTATMWVGVPLLALLSSLVKENGVLLFTYAFVLELCLFGFRVGAGGSLRRLISWHVMFVGLPLLAALTWMFLTVDFSGAPALTRPYNPVERLLTESRVLWMYVQILLLPRLADLVLFYDDFSISRSLFSPVSTFFAVVGILAALIAAIWTLRRSPWLALGVLWFLAGHLIESTVILLELVHVHRNYVPYIGPLVALVGAIDASIAKGRVRLRLALVLSAVLGLGFVTAQRATQWSDPFVLALYELRHRPDSSRTNYELGRLHFLVYRAQKDPRHRAWALQYLERALELDPDSVGAAVGVLILTGGPDHRPAQPALTRLIERLNRRPMNQPEVEFLRSLLNCQSREDCRRPPDELLEVFAAALGHPRLVPKAKADLLALVGLYYARHLHDLPAAVRVMQHSADAAPDNPLYRLNLAQALMVARRLGEAESVLREAERLDRLGAYAKRVDTLKSDLAILLAADAGRDDLLPRNGHGR